MFNTGEHGGGCCGITHLYGFDWDPRETLDKKIAELTTTLTDLPGTMYTPPCSFACDNGVCDNACEGPMPKDWRCAVEVVLNRQQIEHWREALEAVGFKKVFEFLNMNSGNRCYVFYHEINRPTRKGKKVQNVVNDKTNAAVAMEEVAL